MVAQPNKTVGSSTGGRTAGIVEQVKMTVSLKNRMLMCGQIVPSVQDRAVDSYGPVRRAELIIQSIIGEPV